MNTRLRLLTAIVVMTSNGVVWGANSETSPSAQSPSPESNAPDVENTERNVRDKSGATLTPENQVEGDGDRQITAEIRRALVGNDSLSLNVHNVKIITRNRVVTLRGPVESEAEKTTIGKLARQAAGDLRWKLDSHRCAGSGDGMQVRQEVGLQLLIDHGVRERDPDRGLPEPHLFALQTPHLWQ